MLIRDIVRQSKLLVAGHRGYSAKYPENTLLSIQKGIETGVDMIEIDIPNYTINLLVSEEEMAKLRTSADKLKSVINQIEY